PAAILVSAVVSLTLTPMLCAKLLKPVADRRPGAFARAAERQFDNLLAFYGRTLRWVLGHQTGTLIVAIGTLALTLMLYLFVPKGLFPIQDTGVILGISEAPQNISFDAMAERQRALGRVILQDQAVAGISSFIGLGGQHRPLHRRHI